MKEKKSNLGILAALHSGKVPALVVVLVGCVISPPRISSAEPELQEV